ncbi:MAG: alanine racemase [Cyanobacteria bacterium P01_A01_bin.84]
MLSHEEQDVVSHQHCNTYAWFSQRAWVEIDLAAISYNVTQLRSSLGANTQLMAVVKADAYGHGSVAVTQMALKSGASWLGVATVPEGIHLREAGIDAPILILGATYTLEQIHAIAHWKLQPTICSPKQALVFSDTLAQIDYYSPIAVHMKLDTGMSRLGTNWQQACEFVQLVQRLPYLEIASIYSHLATADSPDRTIMNQQHQRFQEAVSQIKDNGIQLPPLLHFANSAATLCDRKLHYDLVRVGLALYGLYPAPHLQEYIELKPVLQLKARITQVKTIASGSGVSYGHQFVTNKETRIAVVGIGYADGVPRNLSNKMQVIVCGQRVPQIGAITMDQLIIDISSVTEEVQEGEIVTLLGKEGKEKISAQEWADELNTISWEILCGFKHRLPRIAVV